MNENRGTLEALAGELVFLLAPLTRLSGLGARAFLEELGLVLSDAQFASLAPALAKTTGAVGGLIHVHFELNASIDAGSSGVVVQKRVAALAQIADVISSFEQLRTSLGSLGLPGAGATVAALPKRLFDHLLATYLSGSPPATQVLELAGVLVRTDHNVGVFDPATPFYTTDEFDLGRIEGWLGNPTAELGKLYDWGKPGFDGGKLMDALERLAAEFGWPVLNDHSVAPRALDLLVARLSARTDLQPPGLELVLNQGLEKGAVEIGRQRWVTSLTLDTGVPSGTSILLRSGALEVHGPDATKLSGSITVAYATRFEASEPLVLLSFLGIGRVSVDQVAATLRLGFAPDGSAQLSLGADLKHGLIRIGTDDADGFVGSILSGFSLSSPFDLGVDYSLADGLHFRGSSALEVRLASHIKLGPVDVDALTLTVGLKNGSFPIGVLADLRATLGPLTAVLQGIGLEIVGRLASDNKGNLGPLDLRPRFVPPNGISLGIDAGGFAGGGFLKFDEDRAEYGGGLELDFLGLVTLKAVGLVTTKFPDGHRGFSLVIIISAEFAPIQLSFGFTLIGVGGLLGLSRTVDTDAMREGMHRGALDSVLFPRDVAANAPRIVNDLRQLFPPAEGHFLIGPMVKFGWGTPTILSLEFGLILDIPRPAFVIIGRFRAGLPLQALPLIDIRVTFAGGVDFAAGQLWFDATLHDSRILTSSLTGDMAVRLYWKENANFIMTVGGFHPAYTPPPMGLGALQRLSITIFDGQPSLRAEVYFAVTSNTLQFGAKAELMYGIDLFNVYGFIALDVLIQFDPFRFIAELAAMLGVRSGTEVLMAIRIDALLEGPQPWHVNGTGHFEISIIISVSFDVAFEATFGDAPSQPLPPVEVLPQLAAAFAEDSNWRAVTPTGSNVQVSLRQFQPAAGSLILHPFGSLEITERLVPLNLPIQKLGAQKISDGRVFGVQQVLMGGVASQIAPLREQFAPAQYVDMDDAQKLSSRSFERYEAGVQVGGGNQVNTTYAKHLSVEYEVVYIPQHRKRVLFRLAKTVFDMLVGGGAVARSPLSAARSAPSVLGAPKVRVAEERFVVASAVDLTPHDPTLVFLSEAEARAAMLHAIKRDPLLTHSLQVIPSYLAMAA